MGFLLVNPKNSILYRFGVTGLQVSGCPTKMTELETRKPDTRH